MKAPDGWVPNMIERIADALMSSTPTDEPTRGIVAPAGMPPHDDYTAADCMPTRTLAELRAAMTPGPWWAASDGAGRMIAWGLYDLVDVEDAIAAVPELLAVLEAVVKFLQCQSRDPVGVTIAALDTLYEAHTAALAKLGIAP